MTTSFLFFLPSNFYQFPWQGLVLLYIEKIETSLDETNVHCNSKEEVFRYILTLNSLLENPPGDYPDNLRECLIKGLVRICSFIRYISVIQMCSHFPVVSFAGTGLCILCCSSCFI